MKWNKLFLNTVLLLSVFNHKLPGIWQSHELNLTSQSELKEIQTAKVILWFESMQLAITAITNTLVP